jgi:Alpha/beta hydrolase
MSSVVSAASHTADVLRAACAQLDDVGSFARRIAPASWIGQAAAAYRLCVADHTASTDAMSLLLREAATAMDVYVAALASGQDPDAAAAALLGSLVQLQPEAWRTQVGSADPGDDALRRCPRDGSPAQIARWWQGLSAPEREAVIVVAPGLIGRLGGLPAAVRSLANQLALTRDLAAGDWRQKHASLSPEQRQALRHSKHTEQAWEDLEERGHTAELYLYDPSAFDGDGSVAIAVGDVDTATHLGILVPGFGHDGSDVTSLSERVANLYEAADHASDESIAVLGWLGYDTPDNLLSWGSDLDALSVVTTDPADAGGWEVDRLIDGLRAADDNDRVHITAIGHSYGSTTLGQAAHDHAPAIDDLVVLGSPGLGPGVDDVRDLGLSRDHVWVGANSRDPVVQLGDHGWVNPGAIGVGLGSDPAEDDFDAQRFRAESVDRASGDNPATAIADHSKYFDHDTESLGNLGYIIADQPELVERADPVTDTWRDDPHDPEWHRDPQRRETRP